MTAPACEPCACGAARQLGPDSSYLAGSLLGFHLGTVEENFDLFAETRTTTGGGMQTARARRNSHMYYDRSSQGLMKRSSR